MNAEIERLLQWTARDESESLRAHVAPQVEDWESATFAALHRTYDQAVAVLEALAAESWHRGLPEISLEPEAAAALAEIAAPDKLPQAWARTVPGVPSAPVPALASIHDAKLRTRTDVASQRLARIARLTLAVHSVVTERVRGVGGETWAANHLGPVAWGFLRGDSLEVDSSLAWVVIPLQARWRELGPVPTSEHQGRILALGAAAGGATHWEAVLCVADILRESGNPEDSEALLGQCALASPFWWELGLFEMMKIAFFSGRLHLSSACAHAAIDSCLRQHHLTVAVSCLLLLTGVQDHLGEPRRPRILSTEALRLSRAVGDRALTSSALTQLASLHALNGDLADAVVGYRSALEIQRTEGRKDLQVTTLGNLGRALNELGEFRESRRAIEEALSLSRGLRDRRREAMGLGHLAALYKSNGNRARAAETWRSALEHHRALGDPRMQAAMLLELSDEKIRAGRWAEVLSEAREVKVILGELGDQRLRAAAGKLEATALARVGNAAAAARAFEACARELEAFGDRDLLGSHLTYAARFELERGNLEEAWSLIERSCELLSRGMAKRKYMRALQVRGSLEAKAGERARALASHAQATGLLESLLSESGSRLGVVLGEALALFEDQVSLLLNPTGPPEDVATAFGVAERARGRALMASIHGERGAEPDLRREGDVPRRRIEAKLRALQSRLMAEQSLEDPREKLCRHLEDEVAAARRSHERILRDLEIQFPVRAAEEGLIPPLSLEDIQRRVIVSADTAMLSYFAAGDRMILWVVRVDGISWCALPISRAQLEEKIEAVLEPFQKFAETRSDFSLLSLDPYGLRELGELLVDPALENLDGVNRLLIVPWGMLHRVPFEMLGLGLDDGDKLMAGFGDVHYLAEDFDVAYGPSASLLDPNLGHGATAARKPKGDSTWRDAHLVALGASSSADSAAADEARPGGLAALSGARDEIRSIAQLFESSQVLLGTEARESAYRRFAPQAGIVHFGGHGHLDDQSPLHSGIVLAHGDSGDEDALLQGYEISEIGLRGSPLVVLAACEAGAGCLSTGEGLLGLSRAFIEAGAGAVLASPWLVDDLSTRELLEDFYRALVQTGADPMAALGQAKRAFLARGRASSQAPLGLPPTHPFHWASFRLQGIATRHG